MENKIAIVQNNQYLLMKTRNTSIIRIPSNTVGEINIYNQKNEL